MTSELKLVGIDKLKSYKKKINVLSILGSQRDENTYSDMIAALLKADKDFIYKLLDKLEIKYPSELKNCDFEVSREHTTNKNERIDLVVKFKGCNYIIGIENKIDADEGPEQIERYQEFFEHSFKNYDGLFLFLTPDGRKSTTCKESPFICFSFSYKLLLVALEEIKNQDNIQNLVTNFIDSIKENIVMDTEEEKEISAVWGNKSNRAVLTKLIQNRPTILTIADRLYLKINKYLAKYDDEIAEKRCGGYSNLELHLRLKSLNRTNIPITFLFYDDIKKGDTPSLRMVLWTDDFESMPKKRIKEYKEKNTFLSFDKLKNWNGPWYVLYSGKNDEPDFSVNIDHDYSDGLVDILFEEFKKQYKKLRGFINL
jgi:hypothetical protein